MPQAALDPTTASGRKAVTSFLSPDGVDAAKPPSRSISIG
jgi:hypothetical protein